MLPLMMIIPNISGSMHSGYPMMSTLDDLPELVNATRLRQHGTWGLIHEIGHNHQWRSWTTASMVDTSCNWFALYVNEKVSKDYYAMRDIYQDFCCQLSTRPACSLQHL